MRISFTILVISLLLFKYSVTTTIPLSVEGIERVKNRYYHGDTPVDGEIKIDNGVVHAILRFDEGKLMTSPIILLYSDGKVAALIGKTHEIHYDDSGMVKYATAYIEKDEVSITISDDILCVFVNKKLLFSVVGTYDLRISLFEQLSNISTSCRI